jgi:hypothetical protein
MRRAGLRVVATVMGAALLAGACQTDRKVTEPEPQPVTEKRLTAALLTAEDVPASFTQAAEGVAINTEAIPEHECDDALADLAPEEEASVAFTSPDDVLSNTIAWFPGGGGDDAEAAFRDLFEDCDAVVVPEQDLDIRTNGLDFGVLSDDVLALRIEVEPAVGAIEERDVIVMREGDLVSVIRLTGPRPSDKELLDSVTRVALGNLGKLADDTT